MKQAKKNPLGKKINAPKNYCKDILFPIKRDKNNAAHGVDRFTLYEVSYLNTNHLPQSRIVRLYIPHSSPYIIESKSLKLYLNSLNFECFSTEKEFLNTLQKDLEELLQSNITLECFLPDELYLKEKKASGLCLENTIENQESKKTKKVHTHLFRSLCPVTGQPDWATIELIYEGKEIKHQILLTDLIENRNKEGFHESCIDSLFETLTKKYKFKKLCIIGYFSRRGGIDITPIRSTHKTFNSKKRLSRQ